MDQHNKFKIVAVGEDFAAVIRAQELTKRLAAELEPMLEIAGHAWKFEEMDLLQVRKEAGMEAAKADMVIIAASGAFEPPARVKSWIEGWLPQKRKAVTALVALLDHYDETAHTSLPLCVYLRRLAGKWNLDFFSNSADWWQQYFESTTETWHQRQENRRSETSEALAYLNI